MGGAIRFGGADGERVVRELRDESSEAGFDLVQPFEIGWYNSSVEPALRLEDFGSDRNLGVLIGNTRALWPKLLARLQRDPALLASRDPLDSYTEEAVRSAVSGLGVPARLRWSHAAGEGLVAMQRLAHAAGLAYLSETHLSVHPRFGPWIALRAVVSFDVRAPALERPALSHPCGSCKEHCLPAFERARAATGAAVSAEAIRAHYPRWLAVRDACPTGRAHRYGDDQILYHYLGDREQLLAAARAPA